MAGIVGISDGAQHQTGMGARQDEMDGDDRGEAQIDKNIFAEDHRTDKRQRTSGPESKAAAGAARHCRRSPRR